MVVRVKSANIVRAKNGSLTVKVNLDDEQSFFLHSTYSPEQEAQKWLKNIKLQSKTAYVVLGVGLGYHIKALLAVLPEGCQIFSVESSINGSFLKVVNKADPTAKWVSDKRFTPLVDHDINDMSGTINKAMQRKGVKRIIMCKHFPSMQMDSEFYVQVEKELVKNTAQLYAMDSSYQLAAGGDLLTNAWANFSEILSVPGIEALKDKFKGMPAIMVAGGPSLDKNIHVLKKYADKAVIICAGSTMGTLHHYGIKPHFLVAIDPFPGMEKEFEGCLNEETYLLTCYTAPNALISNYPGPKLFCKLQENTPNANALNGVQHLLPKTSILYANISVATTAVSFGIHIGADPIILVGQDLSYSEDEHTHAKGSKAYSYSIGRDKEELVSVSGYYGGEVKTMSQFKIALDFYSSLFSYIKDRKFINATEGGAYIGGASHMTLQEAADQYMKDTIDIFNTLEKEVSDCNKFDDKAVTKFLRECIQCNDELLQQATTLLVEVDNCPAMIFAGDIEGVEREFEKMREYFEVVRSSPVYIHLVTYLDPLMQSFFVQEGYVDIEEKFLNHIALFSYIRIALKKVNDLMNMAISDLEKNE